MILRWRVLKLRIEAIVFAFTPIGVTELSPGLAAQRPTLGNSVIQAFVP